MNIAPLRRLCSRTAAALAAASLLTLSAVGEPAQMLSDMLLRVAAEREGGGAAPQAADLTQMQVLLDLAAELTPDEPEVLRQRVRVARARGDQAGLIEALDRYLELEPEHDAFRYERIMTELADFETLDGRLALLENELAKQGQPGYTAALRSRLASSAAKLAQELGDQERFIRNLKTAVRADVSNGDAAALTYGLALERAARPRQMAAAAINLVRARPVDSEARLLLADALTRVGLYERAAEQFAVAARLPRNTPIAEDYFLAWSSSLIGAGQIGEARDMLEQVERFYAEPADEGLSPREVPIELLLHRRILEGSTDTGRAAYARIEERLRAAVEAGNLEAGLELAWIRAVFAPDTEGITPLLQNQDNADPRYLRTTGFLFMRDGQTEWARSAFESIAEVDGISAYGLALLQGRDEVGRARFLREVVHAFPGDLGGLLAASELQQMQRPVSPGPDGRAIADAMDRLPATLWRVDTDRNPWISVRAQMPTTRTSYLEPIVAELTVTNALDLPMAVDPAAGMDDAAVVTVTAFVGGRTVGQMPPVFADLGRYLTMQPKQRRTFPVRLDLSRFGLVLAMQAGQTLTYNSTFVLGPRFLPNGGMALGPLGAIDTVRAAQAFLPAVSEQNVPQWTADAAGSGTQQLTALALLARSAELFSGDTLDRTTSLAAVRAVVEAYENGDRVTRAWVLLLLNGEDGRRSPFQPIFDAAAASNEPLVRIAYLAGQVSDADHPALAEAIENGPPPVRRFAEAWRQTLSRPAPEQAGEAGQR
jgi:tetratricopeptide (TPR) repeat protein